MRTQPRCFDNLINCLCQWQLQGVLLHLLEQRKKLSQMTTGFTSHARHSLREAGPVGTSLIGQ